MAKQKSLFRNTNPIKGEALVNIELDKKELQGILAGNFKEAANDMVVNPLAKAMAFGAREGLSWILSKNYQVAGRTVGASEASSVSLGVSEMAASPFGNGKGYAVYEGSPKTIYIRTGTPPQKVPPISEIKAWIVDKGMGNFSQNAIMPASLQGMSAQQFIQQQRSTNDALTKLAWRIAMGIKKRGTSIWHKPMYPGGQKRFDYVVYAVKKLKMLDQLAVFLYPYFPHINKVVVGYLKTGRWDKDSVFRRIKIKRPI